MKIIKQISTGQVVHVEEPHTLETINNAASASGIALADLMEADVTRAELDALYFAQEGGATLIKAEARRRILHYLPEWKQSNMTARAVELNKIRADAGGWTQVEQAEMDAIQAAWAWIKSVRDASNSLESTLPTDYKSDTYWPAEPIA